MAVWMRQRDRLSEETSKFAFGGFIKLTGLVLNGFLIYLAGFFKPLPIRLRFFRITPPTGLTRSLKGQFHL